jgi:hypothetical protein
VKREEIHKPITDPEMAYPMPPLLPANQALLLFEAGLFVFEGSGLIVSNHGKSSCAYFFNPLFFRVLQK